MGSAHAAVAARSVGIFKKMNAAVNVDDRYNIKTLFIYEFCDFVVFPVVGQKIIEKIKRNFSGLNLVPMDISINIDRWLIQFRAGFWIIDRHGIDIPSFIAFPDNIEFSELRLFFVKCVERFNNHFIGVVIIETEGHGYLVFLVCCGINSR
jgi:hypothetical protein